MQQTKAYSVTPTGNGILRFVLMLYFVLGPLILTQDLPVHIYSGRIMWELLFSSQSTYAQWFEWGNSLLANSFTQWMAALLSPILSPEWIHRLLLWGMFSTVFTGTETVLQAWHPARSKMAAMVLPFLMPVLFLKGFSNFFFGIGFLLHLIAIIPRSLEHKQSVRLLLLSLLLFCTHPLIFWIGIPLSLLMICLYQPEEGKIELKRKLSLAAWLLPAIGLQVLFGVPAQPLDWNPADAGALWENLKQVNDWAWYSRKETTLFRLLLLVLVFTAPAVLLNASWSKGRVWTLVGMAALAGYFYCPSGISENLYLHARVLILMTVFLALGLAASDLPEGILNTIRYLFLAGFFYLLWNRFETQQKIAADFQQLQQAESRLQQGQVVLPLVFAHGGNYSSAAGIFLHAAPLVTDHPDVIFLDNYAAHTDYFPIRWKAGKDPYTLLGPLWEAQPPKVDSAGVAALKVTTILTLFAPDTIVQAGELEMENGVVQVWERE